MLRLLHWVRSFNISTADVFNDVTFRDAADSDVLGQNPFLAPSVFNFYRPGYVAPGTETGERNIRAPELQIINEATATSYINTMSDFIRDDTLGRIGTDPNSYKPDYSTELSLADDPAALVDRLNLILTAGRMTAETRGRIVNLLNEIPIRAGSDAEDRLTRVELAVLMAVTSPEYRVQK